MRPGWPGLMLLLLEHDGGDVADLGVSALAVVEADELGEACGEFVECGEGMPVVELVFEDRPERLGGGVVAARSGGARGPGDAVPVDLEVRALRVHQRKPFCFGGFEAKYAAALPKNARSSSCSATCLRNRTNSARSAGHAERLGVGAREGVHPAAFLPHPVAQRDLVEGSTQGPPRRCCDRNRSPDAQPQSCTRQ